MTPADILAMVKAADEVIAISMRVWQNIRGAGHAAEDAAAAAELDARHADYERRIAEAKQRGGL